MSQKKRSEKEDEMRQNAVAAIDTFTASDYLVGNSFDNVEGMLKLLMNNPYNVTIRKYSMDTSRRVTAEPISTARQKSQKRGASIIRAFSAGPVRVQTTQKINGKEAGHLLIDECLELFGSGIKYPCTKLITIKPRILKSPQPAASENAPRTVQSVRIGYNYIRIDRKTTLKQPEMITESTVSTKELVKFGGGGVSETEEINLQRKTKSDTALFGTPTFNLIGPLVITASQNTVYDDDGGYKIHEEIELRADNSTAEPETELIPFLRKISETPKHGKQQAPFKFQEQILIGRNVMLIKRLIGIKPGKKKFSVDDERNYISDKSSTTSSASSSTASSRLTPKMFVQKELQSPKMLVLQDPSISTDRTSSEEMIGLSARLSAEISAVPAGVTAGNVQSLETARTCSSEKISTSPKTMEKFDKFRVIRQSISPINTPGYIKKKKWHKPRGSMSPTDAFLSAELLTAQSTGSAEAAISPRAENRKLEPFNITPEMWPVGFQGVEVDAREGRKKHGSQTPTEAFIKADLLTARSSSSMLGDEKAVSAVRALRQSRESLSCPEVSRPSESRNPRHVPGSDSEVHHPSTPTANTAHSFARFPYNAPSPRIDPLTPPRSPRRKKRRKLPSGSQEEGETRTATLPEDMKSFSESCSDSESDSGEEKEKTRGRPAVLIQRYGTSFASYASSTSSRGPRLKERGASYDNESKRSSEVPTIARMLSKESLKAARLRHSQLQTAKKSDTSSMASFESTTAHDSSQKTLEGKTAPPIHCAAPFRQGQFDEQQQPTFEEFSRTPRSRFQRFSERSRFRRFSERRGPLAGSRSLESVTVSEPSQRIRESQSKPPPPSLVEIPARQRSFIEKQQSAFKEFSETPRSRFQRFSSRSRFQRFPSSEGSKSSRVAGSVTTTAHEQSRRDKAAQAPSTAVCQQKSTFEEFPKTPRFRFQRFSPRSRFRRFSERRGPLAGSRSLESVTVSEPSQRIRESQSKTTPPSLGEIPARQRSFIEQQQSAFKEFSKTPRSRFQRFSSRSRFQRFPSSEGSKSSRVAGSVTTTAHEQSRRDKAAPAPSSAVCQQPSTFEEFSKTPRFRFQRFSPRSRFRRFSERRGPLAGSRSLESVTVSELSQRIRESQSKPTPPSLSKIPARQRSFIEQQSAFEEFSKTPRSRLQRFSSRSRFERFPPRFRFRPFSQSKEPLAIRAASFEFATAHEPSGEVSESQSQPSSPPSSVIPQQQPTFKEFSRTSRLCFQRFPSRSRFRRFPSHEGPQASKVASFLSTAALEVSHRFPTNVLGAGLDEQQNAEIQRTRSAEYQRVCTSSGNVQLRDEQQRSKLLRARSPEVTSMSRPASSMIISRIQDTVCTAAADSGVQHKQQQKKVSDGDGLSDATAMSHSEKQQKTSRTSAALKTQISEDTKSCSDRTPSDRTNKMMSPTPTSTQVSRFVIPVSSKISQKAESSKASDSRSKLSKKASLAGAETWPKEAADSKGSASKQEQTTVSVQAKGEHNLTVELNINFQIKDAENARSKTNHNLKAKRIVIGGREVFREGGNYKL